MLQDNLDFLNKKNEEYLALISEEQRIRSNYESALAEIDKKISILESKHSQFVNEHLSVYEKNKESTAKNINIRLANLIQKWKQFLEDLYGTDKVYYDDVADKQKLGEITNLYNKRVARINKMYDKLREDEKSEYKRLVWIEENRQQVGTVLDELNADEASRIKDLNDELAVVDGRISNLEERLNFAMSFLSDSDSSNENFEEIKENLTEERQHREKLLSKINQLSQENPTKVTYSQDIANAEQLYNDYKHKLDELNSLQKKELEKAEQEFVAQREQILNKQQKNQDANIEIYRSLKAEELYLQTLKKDAEDEIKDKVAYYDSQYNNDLTIHNTDFNKGKASLLSEKNNLIEQQKLDLSNVEERIATFKESLSNSVDSIFKRDRYYGVCLENYIPADILPEKICIGKKTVTVEKTRLIEDLCDGKNTFDDFLELNVRECGNILISDTDSENEDQLYRIVCGIAMKYLEEFPLGSLQVHFCDSKQNVWLTKFENCFQNSKSVIVTNGIRISPRLETINNNNCEMVMKKLVGDITDFYDLYEIDKTNQFHLFVMLNGFSDLVEGYGGDVAQYLENLIGERGKKSGVRFVIVNNSLAKNKLTEHIEKYSTVFQYRCGQIYYNNEVYDVTHLAGEKPDSDIEEECCKMAEILSKQIFAAIKYEDIGFGKVEVDNPYSCVLSVPVGKFGSSVFELPFNCGDEKDGPVNAGYMVLGGTNSGKSSFFHAFVINACMKYSPADLQFWMLDFKDGGASSNYEHSKIPHIRLLSKENKVGDAYCLFQLLEKERERREKLLHEVGLKYRGSSFGNLAEYNKFVDGRTDIDSEHMSRIVLIIDEVQQLFNETGEAVNSLNSLCSLIGNIVVRMRSVGIHIVMIAQNLSMGSSRLLKECFVGNIGGKVTFRLDENFLRESGFGDGFTEKKDEIKMLTQGETFATVDGRGKPVKVKFAFCKPSNFEDYFNHIIEKYSNYENRMIIIGNKDELHLDSMVNGQDYSYKKLLRSPKVIRANGEIMYRFLCGEDTYSLEPVYLHFSENSGGMCAIGSDKRMMSSLCCSLLMGVSSLKDKIVYVCNGSGVKEGIFNPIVDQCVSEQGDDVIKRYRPVDIDVMLGEVYNEYLKRKQLIEEEEFGDAVPIFVVINNISALSKVKDNSDCVIKESDPDSDTDDYVAIFKAMVNSKQKTISIGNIISELYKNGGQTGIFVSCSLSGDNGISALSSIQTSSNKILFNEYRSDYNDSAMPSYMIKQMLQDVRKNLSDGETIAISLIGGQSSKIRPILY